MPMWYIRATWHYSGPVTVMDAVVEVQQTLDAANSWPGHLGFVFWLVFFHLHFCPLILISCKMPFPPLPSSPWFLLVHLRLTYAFLISTKGISHHDNVTWANLWLWLKKRDRTATKKTKQNKHPTLSWKITRVLRWEGAAGPFGWAHWGDFFQFSVFRDVFFLKTSLITRKDPVRPLQGGCAL